MLHAVIGANYGDEGKGLVVDYLSTADTLVVRYNGGSQAGHTVVTPEGLRHEFQHFGAGTFQGARTLFSRHTIVSPSRFLQEQSILNKLLFPRTPWQSIYVDPRALVTTPFDMLLNRAAEDARLGRRHGSCGYGINETVERSQLAQFRIEAGLLRPRYFDDLLLKLRQIAQHWVPRRCAQLGVRPTWDATTDIIESFMADAKLFARHIQLFDDASVIAVSRDVVFEGAQGLRLCETRTADMPHLTRSKPGLPNILELRAAAGREHEWLHTHYVTRAYVTRHGAGPLPDETGTTHPYGWDGPESNVTNLYQGTFRYAKLTPEFLCGSLFYDHPSAAPYVRPTIAMTCCDQVDPETHCSLGKQIPLATGLSVTLEAHGPTRADVLSFEHVTV